MTSRQVTLRDLPNGGDGQIARLDGDPVVVARLRELGFIQGESVRVAGRAPFGEPILVEIRGATVALRATEAQCIHL